MDPLKGWNIIDRTELNNYVSYALSHERETKERLEYEKRLEKAREELYEKYRRRAYIGNARYFHNVILPQIKQSLSEKYNVQVNDLPRL